MLSSEKASTFITLHLVMKLKLIPVLLHFCRTSLRLWINFKTLLYNIFSIFQKTFLKKSWKKIFSPFFWNNIENNIKKGEKSFFQLFFQKCFLKNRKKNCSAEMPHPPRQCASICQYVYNFHHVLFKNIFETITSKQLFV